jgi:serine phosphatase RsbU (regulator of sigma subunit)
MKRVAIFLTLIILGLRVNGQVNKYGVPIIRNYSTQITQGSEQNWCITKDNLGNLYFGNQDRGVIRYDGTKWSKIQIGNNPRIYSLGADSRGIVYVGAAFEFGYLQPDKKGNTEYISLAARVDSIPEIRLIYSIVVQNDKVLFLSPKFIYIYDTKKDSLTRIKLIRFNLIDAFRLVKINDRLIISDNVGGLFELKDSVISPLPGGDFFKKKSCTVLLPYDESKILVGTFYDGLFLYDYKTGVVKSNFINEKINEKLKEVSVYAAVKLQNNLFAIGTTTQLGILVFNKSGELIQQARKENSELEDNTIFALYCDYESKSELWISTYGVISKAYFNIPLTIFSEKQGIESGVNDICGFQGNIYLSSDAGVLKNFVDDQNIIGFKKVPGINTQVFPLKVIKSPSGDVLLAGSLNGLLQISKNDVVDKVDNICLNLPVKQTLKFNARKILQSSVDPSIVYIGLETGGITILKYEGTRWYYVSRIKNIPGVNYGILEKKEGGLWFLTDDPSSLYSLNINGKDTTLVKYGPEKGVADIDMNSLHYIRDELYVTSATGILRYDKSTDKFINDNSITAGSSKDKYSQNLFLDNDGDLWYSGIDKTASEILIQNGKSGIESYNGVLGLLPNVPLMGIMDSEGKIYLLKSKSVYVVDKSNLKAESPVVNTSFVKITAGSDSVVMAGTYFKSLDLNRRFPTLTSSSTAIPVFGYDMNELSFEWTSPYYTEELRTEYSYKLEGYEKEWSKWEGISFGYTMEALYSKKGYTKLPYGRYIFKVRTRTLTGLLGNELNYEFIILKPWYATIFAFFGFALAAFLLIFAIIKAYTRKLKNENIRLEGIVAERTAVVVKQKEELESSIHYASRIQMALLPSEAILSGNIKNYFVLLKPRDIVSGDFYWMTKKGERLYIVAADCTGHGVPGAFMSLLGMSFLDEIIDKDLAPRADTILKELRLHVTESLKQVGDDDEAKDGMDIALLVIDFAKKRIEFSGAYNPCFRVRKLSDEEVKNYKADSSEMSDGSLSNGKYLLETIYASKMPIGISSRMNEEFVFQEWILEKGISYYLFSDGYIDQFGGPNGRKFLKKNFKRLILDLQDYPMNKQKDILDNNLKEWMGLSPQIDDILVMGIRTD